MRTSHGYIYDVVYRMCKVYVSRIVCRDGSFLGIFSVCPVTSALCGVLLIIKLLLTEINH